MKTKTTHALLLVILGTLIGMQAGNFIGTAIFAAGFQVPTKLFDVRSGGQTSTTIVYKDAPSKDSMIDAICDQYGYRSTIPDPASPGQTMQNPQSKQGFANAQITNYLRDNYRAWKIRTAAKTATDAAANAADGELPPQ